ncbi:hypothetical protein VCR4J5_170066 [Vibrio crassostreae]|uniref:Uncharacterized protein n=1 Tax=Vibrio crassostreae TaxID=246167 RepID=A0ABM9QSB1_9VIBR|nr:hypothetical protein VCRA2116O28_100094 [Vibrio crassostreae]CAK1701090.1 hypothetical protein VCRA2116O27_100094 [Vibrio crassostreae]CAK1733790.1 hypothetical protein VCRA2119O44_120058 [Vibrio crassostreae]CAK1734191.1 hypothetical protein VCRA2119O47_120066 [Vibrio crassostreae]CAK1776324.1 hypothetical protein VCRA2119O45_140060 [Vibrio crassostreae]
MAMSKALLDEDFPVSYNHGHSYVFHVSFPCTLKSTLNKMNQE